MKNQYFGDSNDFWEYGLLRCISKASGLSVGVCWMLTGDDGSGDGQDREYLRNPADYRQSDPQLFDRLIPVVDSECDWDVKNARIWDLIPGAEYVEMYLHHPRPERDQYFSEARSMLSDCPVIFLDPDI